MVPRWTQNDAGGLESYITELKSAKAMQVLSTDAMLIYASLVKSGRPEVLGTLNDEQKADLDHFVAYLRNSFGPSQHEQRLRFQRLKQGEDENYIDYFLKCEKIYFQSQNMPKPTGNDFLDQYKEDIKFQYVQGLKNDEVRKLLRLNDVSYEDLVNTARRYTTALKNVKMVNSVNMIEEKEGEYMRSRSSQRSRRREISYSPNRRRRYHCE